MEYTIKTVKISENRISYIPEFERQTSPAFSLFKPIG